MGRDLCYDRWSCDLLLSASSPEVYRLNLEQVCLLMFQIHKLGNTATGTNIPNFVVSLFHCDFFVVVFKEDSN